MILLLLIRALSVRQPRRAVVTRLPRGSDGPAEDMRADDDEIMPTKLATGCWAPVGRCWSRTISIVG